PCLFTLYIVGADMYHILKLIRGIFLLLRDLTLHRPLISIVIALLLIIIAIWGFWRQKNRF
ncbi:MAG: hypothetical protein ABF624_06655, partial [Liquorilactobacillus ghanensis]|uniref:hypothetical protein n=1 Tax=Liquorilactobacillus ghanensis TaxID=399370 RepID=UPI0039E8B957